MCTCTISRSPASAALACVHVCVRVCVCEQEGGDGWWEGRLGSETGIFPENYVEVRVPRRLRGAHTERHGASPHLRACVCPVDRSVPLRCSIARLATQMIAETDGGGGYGTSPGAATSEGAYGSYDAYGGQTSSDYGTSIGRAAAG